MGFKGKLGTCIKCKKKTLVACKNMCQYCYMQNWNNKKEVKEKKKEWEKKNKHKRTSYRKKYQLELKLRRAQKLIKMRTGEFVAPNLLREIFERDNFTCQYCGLKNNLSIDHKVPISKGGKNTKGNLLIACVTCNSMKTDMSVKKFKEKYF